MYFLYFLYFMYFIYLYKYIYIFFYIYFMCSPVEGPRRTETSHFFYQIVGIKVSRTYYLTIYIYIYICCTRQPDICDLFFF